MRLARLLLVVLVLTAMSFVVSAQTPRSTDDPRNIAPTVGTGGPPGGPTGLFTVYDAQTLRRGEYTFSIAYSNFDRDPGDVDIVEVPVSFQVGLNDYIELFFNTDAYRAMKVNSPTNLSGFYLPNSSIAVSSFPAFNAGLGQVVNFNGRVSPAAVVLAPRPTGGTSRFGSAGVFRPQGTQPFTQFPYFGGSAGTFGFGGTSAGPYFGFPVGTLPTLGPGIATGGNGADAFPGIGSPLGSILPGVVLQFVNVNQAGAPISVPTVFTNAPSYLPDAPFLNRDYGESAFSTFTVGGKIRFTGPKNPVGIALVPFYRYYADRAGSLDGFNQLQRGASPGGNRGDIGLVAVADGRLNKWLNLSGNVGYIYNSNPKIDFGGTSYTLLDRPDEFLAGIGVDVPVSKYFQLIGEGRSTKYVGGRTPNAFENDPVELLGGVRIFPKRWMGIGLWYRYHANQQDRDIFDGDNRTNASATIIGGTTVNTATTGVPRGFRTSDDPHGFGFQFFIGRRNERKPREKPNVPPVINSVTLGRDTVTLPCTPPAVSRSGQCPDSVSEVSVATSATDADGDTLLYTYTVSGGRIVGTGSNVSWDVAGLRPGTYTISVGVDDGCGVCGTNNPTTRELRVVECPDCEAPKPPCPTVSVSASAGPFNEGETITFTADTVLNGANPTYNWSVSNGTIASGQGTPQITVTAPRGPATVTATVELGGIDPSCPGTASASASVNEPPTPPGNVFEDEYGNINNNAAKARLDNAAIAAQNDPNSRVYIIAYSNRTGARGNREIQQRLTLARNYLVNNKGIDASRVITVSGGTGAPEPRTRVIVAQAGAPEPTP